MFNELWWVIPSNINLLFLKSVCVCTTIKLLSFYEVIINDRSDYFSWPLHLSCLLFFCLKTRSLNVESVAKKTWQMTKCSGPNEWFFCSKHSFCGSPPIITEFVPQVKLGTLAVTNKETSTMMDDFVFWHCQLLLTISGGLKENKEINKKEKKT